MPGDIPPSYFPDHYGGWYPGDTVRPPGYYPSPSDPIPTRGPLEDLEARVRQLEVERMNQATPGFVFRKYSDAAVDHLLTKYGCYTLAEMDALIANLKHRVGDT